MLAREISVKKYVVRLTGAERERLETLLRARRDDGEGRGTSLRSAPFTGRNPPRLSLGPHARQDRFSCRQDRCRATAGA